MNAKVPEMNRHEKLKADAFDFMLANDDLEAFVDFFSGRILELYGCDQVIYRDVEGRMIVKERPGTPALDFSLCKDCPHFAFDAPVYKDGFTAMDDCGEGWNGIPVHKDCPVRASLTYLVHEEEKVFGYIALHYLGKTHRFTDEEKNTFDRVAKFVSMVLLRRRQQARLIQREGERAAEAKNQILSDVTRALYSYNLTVDLGTGRYKLITGTGGEEAIGILKATTNYREAYAKMMARVRPEYQDQMRELVSFDYLLMNRGHAGYFGTAEYQTLGDDESARWGEVNVTFGKDSDGRPVANLLARDVTAARRAKALQDREIKAAQAKNEVLSEITQSLYGSDVTINLMADTFTLITGTGLEAFCESMKTGLGRPYSEGVDRFLALVPEEYRDEAMRSVGRDVLLGQRHRRGHIGSRTIPWRDPDGRMQWLEINTFMGENERGEPVANILGRNVTEEIEQDRQQERERAAAVAKDRVLSEITKSFYGYNVTVNLTTLRCSVIKGTGCEGAVAIFERCPTYREVEVEFEKHITDPEALRKTAELFGVESMRKAVAEGKSGFIGSTVYPTESENPGEEGVMGWREASLFIGTDADGNPIANILGRNITEEHNEQERQEREREAAAAKDRILSEITQSLYGYNLTVNLKTLKYSVITGTGMDAACELFKKSEDYAEAVRAKLRFVVPGDRERMARLMEPETFRRIAAEGSSGALATAVYEANVNGERQWHETNVFVGRDANGDPIANVLGRNITEQHTRADAEAQLLAAQQASRAKTQFLFNMSHDIRTPMNAIKGFTEMARTALGKVKSKGDEKVKSKGEKVKSEVVDSGSERKKGDSELFHLSPSTFTFVEDCLDKIAVSGELLLTLINSILDMSRIESGKVRIEEVESDVTESFRGVAATMQELAKAKGVDLSFEIGEVSDRYVYADQVHCNRVFVNVISNAIKYSKPNGWVKVRCEQVGTKVKVKGEKVKSAEVGSGSEKENGDSALFHHSPLLSTSDDVACYRYTFEDNGIGMSKEFMGHVFEEFARERNSTTSGVQGTGLGLPLCKSFVELMGGTITCRSTKDVGTIFEVELPFRVKSKDEKVKSEVDEKAKSKDEKVKSEVGDSGSEKEKGNSALLHLSPSLFTSKRVLLVEDNELNREVAEFILKERGFEVDVAVNGREAVEKVCGTAVEKVGGGGAEVEKRGGGGQWNHLCPPPPNHSTLSPAYDLVLMDIQMPVMNGYEATRAIRAWEAGQEVKSKGEKVRSAVGDSCSEREKGDSALFHHSPLLFTSSRPHLPIIALSANAFAEDRAASLAAGMDDHVAKPIKVNVLMDCLAKFLK